MSEGRSGGTSLDELLIERLGEETYAFYRRTLDNHYWQWKYHRVCDQGSLQDLRLILYESGAATLLPHAAWRIDRSAEEYSNHLGLSQKGEIGYYQELFSGLENPLEPRVLLDSGPGNCTALYQMARPGWTMSGMGDALLFSIEGTLNNCLREELRADNTGYLTAYECPTFYGTLKTLEIWSVSEFVLQSTADLSGATSVLFSEPFVLLRPADEAPPILDWQSLIRARELAKELLESQRKHFETEGKQLVTAIMVGFLIDEMVARQEIPNGMEFWYQSAAAALNALVEKFDTVREHAKQVGFDPQALEGVVRGLLADARKFSLESNARQTFEKEWICAAVSAADKLRTVGIISRKRKKMNEAQADLVFTASNEIRRWAFFLEQRELFLAGQRGGDSPEQGEMAHELIVRWLRRPWGIVRIKDIEMAFRGLVPDNDQDTMPRAFFALADFLTTEIEEYLVSDFGFVSSAKGMQALKTFVSRRLTLHTLRHKTQRISHNAAEPKDDRQRARVLIDLFVMWAYDLNEPDRINQIEAELSSLVQELKSGDWLRQYLAQHHEELPLTRRQEKIAHDYLEAPQEFTSRLFKVDEPGFAIERCIDTYPPEEFEFIRLG